MSLLSFRVKQEGENSLMSGIFVPSKQLYFHLCILSLFFNEIVQSL